MQGSVVLKPPFVAEGEERTIYRHDIESFTRMREEVGKEEDVQFDIQVVYDDQADRERRVKEEQEEGKAKFFSGSSQRRLYFTVTII